MSVTRYPVEISFYYSGMSTTIPVPPESLEISRTSSVEVKSNLLGNSKSNATETGLRRFTLSSFFPEVYRGTLGGTSIGKFIVREVHTLYEGMGSNAPISYPNNYVYFFSKAQNEMGELECRITGLQGVSIVRVFIENFSWTYNSGTDHVDYSLSLVESIPTSTSSIIKKPTATSPPVSTIPPTIKFAIGDKVKVVGNYYYDSYGAKPTYVFKSGFVGKVHKIKTDNRSHPIHITNLNGSWFGWIKKGQIVGVVK